MKINGFTTFLVFQLCAVLIAISVAVLRSGPWTTTRWVGLSIAVPAAVLLFVARWQLGRSFSATPQARELVTHGLYSKIRNPLYVCGALMLASISDRAAKAVCIIFPAARLDSGADRPRPQGGQNPRSGVRGRISRVQGKNVVLMQTYHGM